MKPLPDNPEADTLRQELAKRVAQVRRLEAYTVRLQRNLNNVKLTNLNLRRQLKKLSAK